MSRPVVKMKNVVNNDVEAREVCEIISHMLFSNVVDSPLAVKPAGVTTDLQFIDGVSQPALVAA